jgi:probable HAF family extracellular repeat protein
MAIRYSGTGQPEQLGILPGAQYSGSSGLAIDNLGRVVGVSNTVTRPLGWWDVGHAFLFTDAGGLRDLNELATSLGPFATLSQANASNGTTVVGHGFFPDGITIHAFRYQEGGAVTDIGSLSAIGNYQSTAKGINQRGDIVGMSFGNQGDNGHAFIYTNEGQIHDLNEFVDPNSGWTLVSAEAISDNNDVVGQGTRNGATHGFKMRVPNLQPCPPVACRGPGTRDLQTGTCAYPVLPDGSACNDGDACTQDDVCTAGVCHGPAAFACAAPDTCHSSGTCNSASSASGPPSTQDLVGWWKLDGDGADASGGGHNLTLEGNVATAPGRIGMGMKFDGTSCMTSPIWPEARMTSATGMTMMAWIRPDDVDCPAGQTPRAVMGNGWDYSMGSWCYPGPIASGAVGLRTAGAQTWGWGGGLGQAHPGEWMHVTVTWDHSYASVYINGGRGGATSYPITGNFSDGETVFAVGCMISHYYSTGDQRTFNFRGTVADAGGDRLLRDRRRSLHAPRARRRQLLQRQQPVHANGHLPGRDMRGCESRRLRRAGHLPLGGNVRAGDRALLEPGETGRRDVQ